METLNAKHFITQARERLAGKDARKLAAFHTGITAAFALAVTILQYVLQMGIGNTGGLSGMGTTTILQTIQTVLDWANMILAPFWNLGFFYVTLLWARDQYGRRADLLTGFHRLSPCIGLMVTRSLMVIGVMIICFYAGSAVYMMTPASQPITEIAMQNNMDMDAINAYLYQMTEAQTMELLYSMLPMLVVSAVLAVVLLVPLMYRFRLAEYAILNHKGLRAIPALVISAHLMRRRCWQMLKLDLRLWWYYALKVLCMLLCYLEVLLAAAGIALPAFGDGLAFAAYALYLVALFAVETAFRPQVQTAYAVVYETYMAQGPVQRKDVPAKPQNAPWDEV